MTYEIWSRKKHFKIYESAFNLPPFVASLESKGRLWQDFSMYDAEYHAHDTSLQLSLVNLELP